MYHLQAQCVVLKGFTFHTYFVIWSGPQRSSPSATQGYICQGKMSRDSCSTLSLSKTCGLIHTRLQSTAPCFALYTRTAVHPAQWLIHLLDSFLHQPQKHVIFCPQEQLAPTQMEGTADMKVAYQVLEESTCLSHSRLESVADIQKENKAIVIHSFQL